MKVLVCMVIWNKHDMVNWLCSGLIKSFPNKEVDVYFLLDNPIDGTDQLFYDGTVESILKGFNVKFTVHYANPLEQFKFHLQNIGLKYGYENGYDWIICPQDDQKIEDPFLYKALEGFDYVAGSRDFRGKEVGLIGGRDGFDKLDFKNGFGSLFSIPIGANYTWVSNGLMQSVKFLNDGPLIYHKSVIEKVGYHDERFKVFMSELDYCNRCTEAGLQNVLLGMSIVHEKFGTFRSNVYYQRHDYSAQDQKLFNQKWPT